MSFLQPASPGSPVPSPPDPVPLGCQGHPHAEPEAAFLSLSSAKGTRAKPVTGSEPRARRSLGPTQVTAKPQREGQLNTGMARTLRAPGDTVSIPRERSLSVCLSVSLCVSICLYISTSVSLSISLSLSISVCLSLSVSLCLFVLLSLYFCLSLRLCSSPVES